LTDKLPGKLALGIIKYGNTNRGITPAKYTAENYQEYQREGDSKEYRHFIAKISLNANFGKNIDCIKWAFSFHI
jgi:hypothetical protein